MCLIVLALGVHAELPLVLAANRDEFFVRPTRAAEFWPDQPHLLAGRDLEQGGTWLGVTTAGRLAAITNFRNGRSPHAHGRRSRGLLVRDFLLGDDTPAGFLAHLKDAGEEYDGFNLLLGEGRDFYYYSNCGTDGTHLTPGVYGLSNHLLDTPWPKVERAKRAMQEALLHRRTEMPGRLRELLQDDRQAADDRLPDTGVPLEWERLLSSAFIRSADYGTRASTTMLVGMDGRLEFTEHSFGRDGAETSRSQYSVALTQ